MPKAVIEHTPDADVRALACEHFTISNMLRAWDANELEMDEDASAAAITRWWEISDGIAATPATTDAGRRAKLRCAHSACQGVIEAGDRRFALIASALADTSPHGMQRPLRMRS